MDSLGFTIIMRTSIDVNKLKRNTKIMVETESTVFEIIVSVLVSGGITFVRPTKAKIVSLIQKRRSIVFMYTDKVGNDDSVTTSRVLSATVSSSDGSWYYHAIEKKDKK